MSTSRRLLFALVTVLLFLAAAEGVARLLPMAAEPAPEGAALRFGQNPELQEGNARFWAPDPLLFWRMRPHLDVDFGGMPLRTNAGGFRDREHLRDPSRPLVICLGDSTTFGWGVMQDKDRFSNLLASTAQDGKAPAQVFNFGQSGYSTVQGLRLLEDEVLPLQPDVVIFLFGPNDYARASGRRDARQPVSSPGAVTTRAQSFLQRSAFYRRLAAALVRLRDRRPGAARGDGAAQQGAGEPSPGRSENTADQPLRRVPLAEFTQNLVAMVRATRAAGALPVLMTYPRRPPNPILPCPPPEDSSGMAAWAETVGDEAAPLQDLVAQILAGAAGSPDEALTLWRNLPAAAAATASALYGEAWLLQQAGRPDDAETVLAAAADQAAASGCGLDLFSTRLFRYLEEPAAAAYNLAVRQVALEQAVPMVDAARLLSQAQQDLRPANPEAGGEPWRSRLLARWFGADSYFVDVVHPSAHGHALLATALEQAVRDSLPTPGS